MKSDRVNELFYGRIFDKRNQEACRKRILWLCSRATGDQILDFGCSQGIAALILGRENRRVIGVDIDPAAIEYAQQELEREADLVRRNVEFKLIAPGALPFEDRSFDSILFGEVIEHLAYPEDVLQELRRVLKPGGRLALSTPFGVLPHEDHMRTYYLSNLVETIRPFFAVAEVEIVDKYICCAALAAGKEAECAAVISEAQLLKASESAFEQAEWGYIQWRERLRKLYHKRVREIERLEARINSSAEEHRRELDRMRREAETRLAEVRRGYESIAARTAEEHARRLDELRVDFEQELSRRVNKERTLEAERSRAQQAVRQLQGRLSRQTDQLTYFRTELALKQEEVRYRLGDALVRSFYHPWEMLVLPWRTAKLFVDGVSRMRRRSRDQQAEADLLRSGAGPIVTADANQRPLKRGAASTCGGQPDRMAERDEQLEITFTPPARVERPPRLPLTAGVIMDEFTIECFRDECRLVPFTPENWGEVLSADRPDFLFVESTWKGNDGAWRYKVNRTEYGQDDPLPRLVRWCRERGIPTVFWNKEDPPNFERFISAAKLFDFIFTTDEDCIPRYRERTGRERVYALPFAAQPSLHNPMNSKREKLGRLCFAGTYHREKYPQRQADLESLLRPARTRGLTIFDRQHGYGQEERYGFPEEYRPMVRGGLPYLEMVEAYKAYDVFLNINSVRESPTMFSRRVLELLACGTAVISTPSRGMELLLGKDAVAIAETEEQAAEWMDRLLGDPEFRERMVKRGQRRVFSEHTYELRLRQILDTVGLNYSAPRRRVSVVTVTNRPAFLEKATANYLRQNYADKEWIVVLNSDAFDLNATREQLAAVPNTRVFQRPENCTLGECLNFAIDQSQGDYVSKFDDDDYYGEHYLTDQLHGFLYSGADVVGKRTYFAYLEDRRLLALRFGDHEHRPVRFVSGATLTVRRGLFEDVRFPEDVPRGVDTKFQQACTERGYGIYSADRFNFVAHRQKSVGEHTWQISDEEFLQKCQIVDCLDDYRDRVDA